MDIHSRIKERRLELKLSPQELADTVGVSRQTVLLWELPEDQKGTAPRRHLTKKVADALKTTVEYLTLGISANVDPNDKYAFIPRYAEAFKKGPTVNYHDEVVDHLDGKDTYAYRKDLLTDLGARASDCVVVISNDSSMSLGNQLLVQAADKTLVSSKIYVFQTAHGLLVRRVFMRADGSIELRTDQPATAPETYQPDQLPPVLGRVIVAQSTFA
jgi:transcriptional regulator with XRE-family HTH domain